MMLHSVEKTVQSSRMFFYHCTCVHGLNSGGGSDKLHGWLSQGSHCAKNGQDHGCDW